MSIITDGENDVLGTPDPTIPTVASTDADMPWVDPEDRWPQDDDGVVWVREVSCPSPAAADRFHEARRQLRACHDQIVAAEREVERRQAHLVRLRADLVAFGEECARSRCGPPATNAEEEHRLLTSALAVELTRCTRSMASQVNHATALANRLPRVLQAWADGLLHRGQVLAIDRHTDTLTPEQCADYEDRVLAIAVGQTPAQLGRRAVRIARAINPDQAKHRAAKAFARRGIRVDPDEDGSSTLSIRGPSTLIEAAFDRLRRGALARGKEDHRTAQQWMADAGLVQLICGTNHLGLMEGIQAHVSVTMPAPLLTGASLQGTGYRDGESGGFAESPSGQLVDDDTARLLAGAAGSWTRLFTDPVNGVAWATDQYTPPAALRRAIQARDQTCRFPGCTHPAAGCETDHTIGYRITRRTGYDDLASLCASHHQLKHILGRDEGWYVEQVSPGILEWTSPHGRRFVRYPEPQPTAIIRKEERMPF